MNNSDFSKKTVSSKKNPIIPGRGVCDPHMHVFGDRVYLYAGHDAEPKGRNFCMRDWQIWSSADLVEWKLERVLRPEDTYMGESNRCWAVDCAERNGKYYFYFSDGNQYTGVLVGESPTGPFEDVLHKPLLDGTLTTTREYDPAIFRDDDGEYYIVFGGPKWCYGEGCGYYIARLQEDMISLAETPRYIELDHMGDDKASLNKFKGKYYLSYGGFYAVSDCVYGPYKFMGHTGASIDHTSYFEWNGQLFNAITVEDSFFYHRSAGICYVHIKENGELITDPLIVEYGVGKYDANWNHIETEWFMSAENAVKVENIGMPGFSVVCREKAVLKYPKVFGLSDKIAVAIVGKCLGGSGILELREKDEDGKLLADFQIPESGVRYGWNSRMRLALDFQDQLSDEMDLCWVFKSDNGAEFTFDYFRFISEPIV